MPLLEEQQNLTFDQVQEKLQQILLIKEVQDLTEERKRLFDVWNKKRREFSVKLISAFIEGEMGAELQGAAISLYGPSPRFDFGTNEDTNYFVLQAKSLRLAEVEAELFRTRGQIMTLSVEYDRLYPNSVLSVVETIHPMETLNVDVRNTSVPDHIRANSKAFDRIWQTYRNLKAVLPPELPDLE